MNVVRILNPPDVLVIFLCGCRDFYFYFLCLYKFNFSCRESDRDARPCLTRTRLTIGQMPTRYISTGHY